MQSILQFFNQLWSIYDFEDKELSGFAMQQLSGETRQGLKVMSTLLILLILLAMLLFQQIRLISSYSLNYFWVLALAAHINISARVVSDIKTLHALGVTLLVIGATAYVFIAHQAGSFSPLLLVNIVLLFMIIPLVPWGVREAFFVILSIYLLLTLSTLSVQNRFDIETLKVLQFFLLASGFTSLILVVRATLVRKKELIAHFHLQKAHADLYTLSMVDPLTGAWNRRFMDAAVQNLLNAYQGKYDQLQFIILDLDNFKILNDRFGHDFGDRVLVLLSKTILQAIDSQGYLIRMGGDEFILLLVGFDAELLMQRIRSELKKAVAQEQLQAEFGMSWGIVHLTMLPIRNFEAVYQRADQALYAHKQTNRQKL